MTSELCIRLHSRLSSHGNVAQSESGAAAYGKDTFTSTFTNTKTTPDSSSSYGSSLSATDGAYHRRLNSYSNPGIYIKKDVSLRDKQVYDIDSDVDSKVKLDGNVAQSDSGAAAYGKDSFTSTFTNTKTTPDSSSSYGSSLSATDGGYH